MDSQTGKSRVLIFSLRNIYPKALFRGPYYEFEDIICAIDFADLWAPEVDASSTRYTIAQRVAYHAPIALNPGIRRMPAKTYYDIFFTICGLPEELLLHNAAINDLRDICRTSVCLVDELWVNEMVRYRHFLRILSKFDVVMLYYSQTLKPLSEQIGLEMYLFAAWCRFHFVLSPSKPSKKSHRRLYDGA